MDLNFMLIINFSVLVRPSIRYKKCKQRYQRFVDLNWSLHVLINKFYGSSKKNSWRKCKKEQQRKTNLQKLVSSPTRFRESQFKGKFDFFLKKNIHLTERPLYWCPPSSNHYGTELKLKQEIQTLKRLIENTSRFTEYTVQQ